jgi:hypothetical protein
MIRRWRFALGFLGAVGQYGFQLFLHRDVERQQLGPSLAGRLLDITGLAASGIPRTSVMALSSPAVALQLLVERLFDAVLALPSSLTKPSTCAASVPCGYVR